MREAASFPQQSGEEPEVSALEAWLLGTTDDEVAADLAIEEAEATLSALAGLEKYGQQQQAARARRAADAVSAKNALRYATRSDETEQMGWGLGALLGGEQVKGVRRNDSFFEEDDEDDATDSERESYNPKLERGVSEDKKKCSCPERAGLALLEEVYGLDEDKESSSFFERLRQESKIAHLESSTVVHELSERLARQRSSCKRAQFRVSKFRADVKRSSEIEKQLRLERDDAKRASALASERAIAEYHNLTAADRGTAQSEAARRASDAANRAAALEKRASDRLEDASRKARSDVADLTLAADAAVEALYETERCEADVARAVRRLRRQVAAPKLFHSLREIAAAEKSQLLSKLQRLQDLEAFLDDEEHLDEVPFAKKKSPKVSSPSSSSPKKDFVVSPRKNKKDQEKKKPTKSCKSMMMLDLRKVDEPRRVGRALELLREAQQREHLQHPETPEGRGQKAEDLTQHFPRRLRHMMASEPKLEDKTPEDDVYLDKMLHKIFCALPPNPDDPLAVDSPFLAAAAVMKRIADIQSANAVARALNRMRTTSNAKLSSLAALEALGRVCDVVFKACREAGPGKAGHTPAVVLMLSQTFYVDGCEEEGWTEVVGSSGAEAEEERRKRTRRVYLKDKLGPLSFDDGLWEDSMRAAALDAVAATTQHDPPYIDLVFSDRQRDVAASVHQAVQAQLCAFCFSMRDFGAEPLDVANFAVAMARDYQLPKQDRASLLFAFSAAAANHQDTDESQHDDTEEAAV